MSSLGQFDSPSFKKQLAAFVEAPLVGVYSGELTGNINVGTLGAVRGGGQVKAVWMSCGATGLDNDSALNMSGEVYINGTTCLSTVPSISYISGELSQQKTTKISGDTGIQQAVIDQDANTLSPGDVLTYDITIDRTATPATEISSPVIVVEFDPN